MGMARRSCDLCPLDLNNDEDGDSICGEVDKCPAVADPEQADFDGDGLVISRSLPRTRPMTQTAITSVTIPRPDVPDPDQRDRDGDGLGDALDAYRWGLIRTDGVMFDNRPRFRNRPVDTDADGLGDV